MSTIVMLQNARTYVSITENYPSPMTDRDKKQDDVSHDLGKPESWLPGLLEFLREQTQVEAITFDPEKKTIAIATLGKVDEKQLEENLQATLKAIEENIAAHKPQSPAHIPPTFHLRQQPQGGTTLEKPSCYTAPHFWVWREMPWPQIVEAKPPMPEWMFLGILSGLCAFFGLTGFVLEKLFFAYIPEFVPIAFYIASVVAGGWDAAITVWQKIFKRELDIHFLMIAVAVGACLIDAYEEAAILLFLFSFAEALEHYAMDRTRKSIDALFKSAPKEATLIRADGTEERVSVEDIQIGNMLRVRPGDLFAVDGVVTEGETAADESTLTGESVPVDKKIGDEVYAGTVNEWGSVKMEVLKTVQESSLQKIIRLIQEAQNMKAPSQRFTEKFGTHYTIGIFSFVIVMFFVWWLAFELPAFINTPEHGFSAFYRSMALLVVASPCALVISIPSAILAAIAWGAQRGVLFKGGIALEKIPQIDTVCMDKTGTLTTGELSVVTIESFPPGQEKLIATLAFSLENKASHPLARAIVLYGRRHQLHEKTVKSFQSLTGLGVQGEINGEICVLGRRSLVAEGPLGKWVEHLQVPPAEYSEVWVMQKNVLGRLLLKDQIRIESKNVLAALHREGLTTIMLTGDRESAAQTIGKQLGVQEIRFGMSPEDKVQYIYNEGLKGKKVAMIGDGVNDAPSLAAAFVSVAMGARGSDAALEQSEVVLMNDKIENFLEAYDLSKMARRIIRQNLTISLGVICLMVVGAVFGIVPLTLGVIAHEGSTLVVSLNSLRLLFKNPVNHLRKSSHEKS